MQVLADVSSESFISTSENTAERPNPHTYLAYELLSAADTKELSSTQKCLKLCEVLTLMSGLLLIIGLFTIPTVFYTVKPSEVSILNIFASDHYQNCCSLTHLLTIPSMAVSR